ncbi:MAG: TonB-dependent receptor, partial [Thermoanaerobaculia bacterium]|nr:TonB-dependent receptor [Thermoanaerobaculia bacterium]
GRAETKLTLRAGGERTVDLELRLELAETITVSRDLGSYHPPQKPSAKSGVLTTLEDTPSSISIIPESLIDDQRIQGLEDVTKNVAGLSTRGSYYGGYTRINLRGFNLDELSSFYRNGVKVYYRGTVVTDNLERIEILKGPASVLANDVPPGGIINLVTKKPVAERLLGLELGLGSEGERKLDLDYNLPRVLGADNGFRLNTSYEDSETFVDEVEKERFFLAPVWQWALGESTSVVIDGEYEDFSGTVETGLFVPPASSEPALIATYGVDRLGFLDLQDESTFLGEPGAVYDWRRTLIDVELDHVFASGMTLSLLGSWADYDRDVQGVTLEGFVDDDPATGLVERGDGFPGDSGFFLSSQQTLAFQASLQGTARTGAVDNSWIAGLDWEDRKEDYPNRGGEAAPIDVFDPVYTGAFVGPDGSDVTFGTEDGRYGLFAQNQFSFSGGLSLLLGLRYTDFNNDRLYFDDFESPDVTDHEKVTVRAGLVFSPVNSPSTTFFASFNTSFLPVDAAPQAGLPDPDPIEGEQIEVGVKKSFWGGRLFGQVSYYDVTQENIVIGFAEQSQTGEVETSGFELELIGQVNDQINLSFNLATSDRKNPDNSPGFRSRLGSDTPDLTGNLWLVYRFGGTLPLSIGGGIEYVDERPIPTGGGEIFVPSYERIDLYAAYDFNQRFGLRLNLENVFDERYYLGQQVFNGTGVIVGAPTTATLTFSYKNR